MLNTTEKSQNKKTIRRPKEAGSEEQFEQFERFDTWNEVKKRTNNKDWPYIHERDIVSCRVGKNIGFEQSGKGNEFVRPVLVFKKFTNRLFWGIPLSTTKKRGKYYHPFAFTKGIISVAILSQLRMFDAKRLDRHLGMMKIDDFRNIKRIISEFINSIDDS